MENRERLYDAEHWRKHAEEARTISANVTTESARQLLLQVAKDYEQLAEQAEQREGKRRMIR